MQKKIKLNYIKKLFTRVFNFSQLTLVWTGFIGCFMYEKPSPQPVGSAEPLSWKINFNS